MSRKNILVVGAGLSGVTVAYQLIKKNVNITLIDNQINHSSIVAAGMINPLVFRRMNKSWRADEFIPYLHSFYREVEAVTGVSFFHPIKIRRMFSSEQERNYWLEKQSTKEYQLYMAPITKEDDNYTKAKNQFGSGRVQNASYVDTSLFLNGIKAYISQNGTIQNEEFDYSQLKELKYKGVTYDDIIFCEGYLGKENPWFGQLPIGQTKGEVLVIKANSLPNNESVNRKCFILPLGNHHFKVGSTYEWNCTDTSITEKGKNAILEKISYLTDEKVTVIDQKAGIRPTSIDRRPLIGSHPEINNYHIFNGLGTKGYMISPLLSEEFTNYLLSGNPLNKEVDIQRFYQER